MVASFLLLLLLVLSEAVLVIGWGEDSASADSMSVDSITSTSTVASD